MSDPIARAKALLGPDLDWDAGYVVTRDVVRALVAECERLVMERSGLATTTRELGDRIRALEAELAEVRTSWAEDERLGMEREAALQAKNAELRKLVPRSLRADSWQDE